jgi:hypothetical protein
VRLILARVDARIAQVTPTRPAGPAVPGAAPTGAPRR